MSEIKLIKRILEAILFTSEEPVSLASLKKVLEQQDDTALETAQLRKILEDLQHDYQGKGVELIEVASGFRFQANPELSPWLARMMQEKPPKYSRAVLETLAIIAYQQPVTRGDIESVRGVAVSSHIIKMLEDRGWIKLVGHKEVPGRPGLYATTKTFLDYFNLKNLADLPILPEPADKTEEVNMEQLGFRLQADKQLQTNAAIDETVDAQHDDTQAKAEAEGIDKASGKASVASTTETEVYAEFTATATDQVEQADAHAKSPSSEPALDDEAAATDRHHAHHDETF